MPMWIESSFASIFPHVILDVEFLPQHSQRNKRCPLDGDFRMLGRRADVEQDEVVPCVELFLHLQRGDPLPVAGQFVLHDIRRDDKVIHGRGIGWRIAEIQ